jgi:hypothetical protein
VEPELVTAPADRAVLEELRRREPIFHRPEFLGAKELERMVAPQFWEVGASGRRYSRAYVLDRVAARGRGAIHDEWRTRDFHVRALGADLYHLTYTLEQGERLTRRSSLWQRHEGAWRILFHQGTVVEDPE